MEPLLDAFGGLAWGPVVALALPLAALGWMMRRAARRRGEAIALGACFVGTWRGRGLVERDDGAALVVAREHEAEAIVAGARVLVVGCVAGEAADPRGAGYREHARLPRVVAELVTTDVGRLEREARRARRAALVGAVLFAAGLATAVMAMLVALRAVD